MLNAVPSPDTARSARRHKPSRLLVILVAGLVLLTVAGLLMIGAYLYLSRTPTAPLGWLSPLDDVHNAAIAPDLAVLTLAGEPDDRVIRAAIDAGETETAYAALAYSVLLPDSLRSGHWLLLCGRYAPEDAARVAACYRVALDMVALSPQLGDLARADIALQASRGFVDAEQGTLARLALAEAENIARYSLTLLPAQRRNLLQQIATGYRAVGENETAQIILGRLESSSVGPGIKLEQSEEVLASLHGSIVLSPTLASAIVARQTAAATFAARWLGAPSEQPALGADLARALREEDAARTDFYGADTDLSQADRLALLHDQIAWLTIKYRAARGAYGLSLVPEWEGQAEGIRGEVVAAYTELINGYGRQLDGLSVGDAAVGRVELLRQGVMWTRLGLFPDHAEGALSEQLVKASQQLWTRHGGAGLVIVAQDVQGQRFYLLSGSDAAQPSASK